MSTTQATRPTVSSRDNLPLCNRSGKKMLFGGRAKVQLETSYATGGSSPLLILYKPYASGAVLIHFEALPPKSDLSDLTGVYLDLQAPNVVVTLIGADAYKSVQRVTLRAMESLVSLLD